MRRLLLVLALASPALAQTVLTVDSSGNVNANGNVTTTSVVTESVVVAGTYTSGITTTGTTGQTCLITFAGGVTPATATVALTGTNSINPQALVIVSGGLGYTSPPTGTGATVPVPSSGGATACSSSSLSVATTLGGYVLNALTGPQPSTPASLHGLMWFDNASDWPLAVPMALDASGNASAMVRTGKGTAIGAYTPYYSSIGGLTPPTATLNVYNSTPSSVTTATGVQHGTVTATGGGSYTTVGIVGTNVITQYCVEITGSTTFEWGTDPGCGSFGGGTGSLSTSPIPLSLGVTVTFSNSSGGTAGDNWIITATPGGSTTELLQAGVNQAGNIWAVENNAATVQWAVTQTGSLSGGLGNALTIAGSGGGSAQVQSPSSAFSNYNLNLPAGPGSPGAVLTSQGGGSSPMTWTVLNTTAMTWFGGTALATVAPGAGGVMFAAAGVGGLGTPVGTRVWVSPVNCTLRYLYASIDSAQTATGSLVLTIYDNGPTTPNTLGSTTSIVATFAAGAAAYSSATPDTSHTYPVNAGDYLTVQVYNHGTATSATLGTWGVMCVPY
jgi:hypothetical protein